MAKATESQVKQLETALAQQFFNLVQGARFRINLARLADPNKPLSDNAAFMSYSNVFKPLVMSWLKREIPYEQATVHAGGQKGIILSGDLSPDDFFYSASLPKLDALVKKYDADKATNGIGFIPLLIWAVIAIITSFAAVKITDDLTTTTQEKEQLLDKTAQTCKDLKLTPDQCNAMITSTQAQASQGSGLGDIFKYGMLLVGGAILLPQILKSTSKT